MRIWLCYLPGSNALLGNVASIVTLLDVKQPVRWSVAVIALCIKYIIYLISSRIIVIADTLAGAQANMPTKSNASRYFVNRAVFTPVCHI